jgi:hypothetical protein
MEQAIAESERVMQAAAAKAPGDVDQFAPYLRAAIIYWRLRAEAAQAADDSEALVEATTERITYEDLFRDATGRSFHTTNDAIDYADVVALPD